MLLVNDILKNKVLLQCEKKHCCRIIGEFDEFVSNILNLNKKIKLSIKLNDKVIDKSTLTEYRRLFFIFDKSCSHIINGLSFVDNVNYWSEIYRQVNLYQASKAFWKIDDELEMKTKFSRREKIILEFTIMLTTTLPCCIIDYTLLDEIKVLDIMLYKKIMQFLSNRCYQNGMVFIVIPQKHLSLDQDIKEYFDFPLFLE